jgi:hypothetical protein
MDEFKEKMLIMDFWNDDIVFVTPKKVKNVNSKNVS